MNSVNIKQEQPAETFKIYSPGEDCVKFKGDHHLQVVSPQQVALMNEENVQVITHGDKEPSHSKTIYICNHCGKKYKHRNCLVKHMWEHHECWEVCLKFNLTKHQQVQMMEAAQILVDLRCIKQH